MNQININEITEYKNNSRKHSSEQIEQIVRSINEFGFVNPVLIDENNQLLAGHGRLEAAKRLALESVPCVKITNLSEAQKKAYVIADNNIALNADWDLDILKAEVENLLDSDFDTDILAFDDDFLGDLLAEAEELQIDDLEPDVVPEPPEEPVTKLGDVWLLGDHRLLCGDCTNIDTVEDFIAGYVIDLIHTDPPYGISIQKKGGNIGDGGLAKAREYAPIQNDSDIVTAVESISIINIINPKHTVIWGGNYYANHLSNSSCWFVWDKNNTGDFADCELAWTNQKSAARIFKHTWNGFIKQSEKGESRVHPMQKPVALAEWVYEQIGDIKTVLDLFGGSGFNLMACEKLNKTSLTIEIMPEYCDVIVKRWQNKTKKQAILENTGQTFNELSEK